MSIDRFLEQTDSLELAELEAVDRIDPIDWVHRLELAIGIVAATIANCHRGRDSNPFEAKDFMVDWTAQWRDAVVELDTQLEQGRQQTLNALSMLNVKPTG